MSEANKPLVVVTGGHSGIGAAVVETLCREGARVAVFDIQGPKSGAKQENLLSAIRVDISEETQVAEAVAIVEDDFGPISGLVNAAGVLGKMHEPDRLRMADWDREMGIDLRGTFLMCRAVGSRMAQRRGGAIVNIASVAGMSSAPVHSYACAKSAVIALTATLAAEWGPRNVRVNAVSPGFTRTPALETGFAAGVLSPDLLAKSSALQRLVEPAEVAHAVVWLLGAFSSGITGINIPVDAGFLTGVTWSAYGGLRSRGD